MSEPERLADSNGFSSPGLGVKKDCVQPSTYWFYCVALPFSGARLVRNGRSAQVDKRRNRSARAATVAALEEAR